MLGSASLAATALLAVMVVIAKGWHITRRRLLEGEWRNVAVMAAVFMISFTTYEIFSGFFFLFLLILVYVLVLRFLFSVRGVALRVLHLLLLQSDACVGLVPSHRTYTCRGGCAS